MTGQKKAEAGWISVRESLPEVNKDVLLVGTSRTTGETVYRVDCWYSFCEWGLSCFYEYTHWMPLPTPPNETEETGGVSDG